MPNHAQLIIIADDVTGAADSAARCRKAGMPASIQLTSLDQERPMQCVPGAVAFSTDSRFLDPTEAAAHVQVLVKKVMDTETVDAETISIPILWYKKIDSTLRGNIGSELAAMLPLITPAGESPRAIICPAFPAQQRALVDGYLDYANLPPRTIHLPTLLAEQCDLPLVSISLATIRGGEVILDRALRDAADDGAVLFVCDAETEEDLVHLLAARQRTMSHALCCGSAGLVGVWAREFDTAEMQASTEQSEDVGHPVLAVVGSGSTMARRQLHFLDTKTDVITMTLDPQIKVHRANEQPAQIIALQQRAALGQQGETKDVAICLPPPAGDTALEGEVARQYAQALATCAMTLIDQLAPPTLILVGGDTAIQVLSKLGIHRLDVQRELLPGMPLTTTADQMERRFQVILKAGNHGEENTLAILMGQPVS